MQIKSLLLLPLIQCSGLLLGLADGKLGLVHALRFMRNRLRGRVALCVAIAGFGWVRRGEPVSAYQVSAAMVSDV